MNLEPLAGTRTRPLDALSDPVRVASAGLFLLVLAVTGSIPALLAALAMALALAPLAGLTGRRLVVTLLHAEIFVIALVLTLPFTVAGTPVLSLFGVTASQEGLARALSVALRINAALLVVAALIAPLGAYRLATALVRLRMPARLATLLLLVVRHLETLGAELARQRRALAARGFAPSSRIQTWKTSAYLIGTLVLRASARAERIGRAMTARGFDGTLPPPPGAALSSRDHGALAAASAACLTLVVIGLLVP